MLDIQFIRENSQAVTLKSAQKGYKVDVPAILELDTRRRALLAEIEELRARRNELAGELKSTKPSPEQIEQGKQLKEKIAALETELEPVETDFDRLLKQVPNMPLDDVPLGKSEDDNKVAKTVGEKIDFDYSPKGHWEIAETRDLIDKSRAAKVAGARFAYIKGDLVRLQFAIIQFVIKSLGDEKLLERLIQDNNLNLVAKPFVPILPPAMIKTSVFAAMDRLEPRDDRYKVGEAEDDLWLQGSAEHTLGSMYKDEVIEEAELPIRYVGYSSSFRREAGTYGKDTEGIIRMHQFDKLEMEVFSTAETGLSEHLFLVAIQEYLVQQLGLPYQVILKCTADIGKPNARGIDINVWMPGQGKYLETHTADYMTDYQARRLKTRVRRRDGQLQLVHMSDATAFALGRTMAAIIENFQTHDGHIIIPEVLREFMGGQEEI
ncbi:MAG TPA: serine--tRNA ligase [Candidatus Binatia bacterium]|nr:serine--tRNA ligase [Candidatus Binatia bacterium]